MAAEKDADFKFDKPADWKVIKPAHYKEFAILSTESIPCLYGFATERKEGGYEVITVFDYGVSTSTFINELNEELNRLEKNSKDVNKINDYIKDNAEGYAVTSTTAMVPLLHKTATMFGKSTFINIMQIETNIGKSYSLQIFVKVKTNMLCFGTSMLEIDPSKPFESAVAKYQHVNDLVNVVIKSLEW